jgi:Arrestin (or S-antigen), N-terminal domain
MGGSISRLELEFDQEQGQHELLPLIAGSLLCGSVVIDVKSPIRVDRSSPLLQLCLYGKEKVRMNRNKAKRKAGKGHAPKCAERPIVSIPLQWSSFPTNDNNVIPVGTFRFPFQIQLPMSLPSSTYYPIQDDRSRSKLRFRIQYKIKAELFLPSASRPSKPHYMVTRYVWIAAATSPEEPRELTPCMVAPMAQELKSGFFQKKGIFLFCARVDNTRLGKDIDQHVALHLSCRNDSASTIHRVHISILEQVSWGTAAVNSIDPQTGSCRASDTLQQTEDIPMSVLDNVHLPGLIRESKGFLKSAVEAMFGSSTQKTLQHQMYKDLQQSDNVIPIPLPTQQLRESYQGQLIQVSHRVKIVFQTGAFCQTPVLEIPIHISAARRVDLPNEMTLAGAAVYIPPVNANSSVTTSKLPAKLPASTTGTSSSSSGSGSSSLPSSSSSSGVPHSEIPMAAAVLVPDDLSLIGSPSVIVLGGDAVLPHWKPTRHAATSLARLTPMASPELTDTISVPALLSLMRSSLNDYDLIQEKICEPAWIDLFHQISADEYASIVGHVHAFDQTRVAVLLAPFVNRSEQGFTCAYAAAAIRLAAEDHRAHMAQTLIPLCTDVSDHHDLIMSELNGWEQVVTEGILVQALQG